MDWGWFPISNGGHFNQHLHLGDAAPGIITLLASFWCKNREKVSNFLGLCLCVTWPHWAYLELSLTSLPLKISFHLGAKRIILLTIIQLDTITVSLSECRLAFLQFLFPFYGIFWLKAVVNDCQTCVLKTREGLGICNTVWWLWQLDN